MDLQAQIISNLKKTFLAQSKEDRDSAAQFLKTQALANPNFIVLLCQMLAANLSQVDKDYKMIQIAIANYILKHVESLLSNNILLNDRRLGLLKLFYDALGNETIIHRYKNLLALSLGKLLLGTWGENKTIGAQMFKQTIQVLQNGNYTLGVYLFQSLLNSNKTFTFPTEIKQHLLPAYIQQLDNSLKQCSIQVQANTVSFQRIQTLEYGLQLLCQYITKINPEKYRPLLKQILKYDGIFTIILSVLSIAPVNNSQIILPKQVVYVQDLNRLRMLAFSLINMLVNGIKIGKFNISSFPSLLSFCKQLFCTIVQKLPYQILTISHQQNTFLIRKILQFLTIYCFFSENSQFVNPFISDIVYHIALPLAIIPQNIHEKLLTDPILYINDIQEIINQKMNKNTITSNAYKLTQIICDKMDGALKYISIISLKLLEYCISSKQQLLSGLDQKLLNSVFFKSTTPAAKFETLLILFGSLAYKISSRKDIIKEIEAFVIKYQTQILNIKDKNIIFAFTTFYSYYAEDLFKRKQQKNYIWTFFQYFILLARLPGPSNKGLRIQASNTLQNIIQENNFKSFFHQDIVKISDIIINNQTQQIQQIINLFIILINSYTKQLSYQQKKIMQWLLILKNKIISQLQLSKSTLLFSRFLKLIELILSQEEFYLFNQKVIDFFSPCLNLLNSDNQYVDDVMDVVKKYVLNSHTVPTWTPQLIDQVINVIHRQKRLSQSSFGLLNVLLIYMDAQDKNQILKIYQLMFEKINNSQQNLDLFQTILLCHLLIFYHHQQLTDFQKSQIVNKIIRLMLDQNINKNEYLFSKMVLLLLIMLRQQFEFTSLLLEAHNDFLYTFYNIAYNNSSTYVQEYDYKVFVIMQTSIIDKYGHIPKQTQYLHQSLSVIIQLLEKLFKKNQPVLMPVQKNEDDFEDSDSQQQQERIETQQQARSIMQRYISPLKQIDQWNNFKSFFNKIRNDVSRWQFISKILQNLPQKQKRFLSTMALNIQKMIIDGETKLRQVIKIKRPS